MSTLINAFIPAGVIRLIGVAPPDKFTGAHGILPAIAAATALPTFLMTLALTAVLRHRIASGRLVRSPTALESRFRKLSVPLLVRASVLTMLGLIVLTPAAVGLLYWRGLVPLTLYQFTVFNISYGAVIGIVLTPLIVLAAMAEKPVYSARMQQ
jgi:hypothetical protein